MNQALLLNSDLAFNEELDAWQLTGFYQSRGLTIFISSVKLARDIEITSDLLLDLEADIEDWLEDNEPDDNDQIWL